MPRLMMSLETISRL